MSVWIKKTFLNIHLSLKVVVCFSTSRWRLLLNNWSSPLLPAHIPSDIKGLNHLFWRQCICWLHAFCLGTICDIGVCSEHLSHVTKKKLKIHYLNLSFLSLGGKKRSGFLENVWRQLTPFSQSGWWVLTAVSPCCPDFHSWLHRCSQLGFFLSQPLESAAESTQLCLGEAGTRQGKDLYSGIEYFQWLVA